MLQTRAICNDYNSTAKNETVFSPYSFFKIDNFNYNYRKINL